MTVKVKSIVSNQLPDFVRDDHPAFVAFLQAYYDYLDQTQQRNLSDLRDVDKTIDSFIVHFKNELNIFGETEYDHADKIILLRKIKQYFTAKGSEAAYKFLFRILFDKPINVTYPWDQVLKVSDGKWKQDTSIFVRVLSGDVNSIVGNKIIAIGNNLRLKLFVERIHEYSTGVYEVFIDKNFYGTLNINDVVSLGTFSGQIISTTINYSVINPGSGYKVGDLITGITVSGSTNVEQLLKVTEVDSSGGIVRLNTVRFGAGYSGEFFLLTSKTSFNSESTFQILKDSVSQYTIPDDSYIEKYEDYGFIIDPNYWAVSYSNPVYSGSLIREFYTETPNGNETITDFALIRFGIGAIAKYQGYYTSNDGFLDDSIKLQDSKYYQKYSYLITADERLEDYKTILKSYIHSAGLALFAEYQIQSVYTPVIEGQIFVDQYESKATFRTINKTITNDYVSANDIGGRILVDPYALEAYAEETYNPETYYTFTG